MIVYRIEGKGDGLGPYRGHNPWYHLNGLDDLTAWKKGYDLERGGSVHPYDYIDHGHPTPRSDGLGSSYNGDWPDHYVFGFRDMEQVIAWWGDALDLLDTFGYTLACYDVEANRVRFGKTQVCFDRDHPTTRRIG